MTSLQRIQPHPKDLGGGFLVLGFVAAFVEVEAVGLFVLGSLVVALVLFSTLTVEVRRDSMELWFGPGLVRKRFAYKAMRGVRVVRNEWQFGWGIRRLPKGWLYCVSGLDAVEIEMADGHRHRVGTDRPQELEAAIREALGTRPG